MNSSAQQTGQTGMALLKLSRHDLKHNTHHHLFHKLDQYGIRGDVLDWIKNLTLIGSQQDIIDGQKSVFSKEQSLHPYYSFALLMTCQTELHKT